MGVGISPKRIEEMQAFLRDNKNDRNTIYQPIEHPAFDGWKVLQPCLERWDMMMGWLGFGYPDNVGDCMVMDIGCNTGWFCRQFNRCGWDVYGFERSPDWIRIAREIHDWCGLEKRCYVNLDWTTARLFKVDIILFLSAIMYLFKDASSEQWAWDRMGRLSAFAPVMFIDWGGMYAKHLPFNEGTFVEMMLAHTLYTKGELLGRTQFENRPFYVFTRAV